jgi:hypothetical protein
MTVTTLRPSGFPSWSNVTTPATPSTTLNDNNDATTFAFIVGSTVSYVYSPVADLGALGATEIITRVRARVRYDSVAAGTIDLSVNLEDTSTGIPIPADYYTTGPGSGVFVTQTGAWKTTAPDGGAWTAAKVNNLRVRARDNKAGSTVPRIVEMYIDVETNVAPTATGTLPNATVTTTTLPTFEWTYADTEGDVQQNYRVKVFSAAQYGAGGFDPNTSTPTADSGVLAGSALAWTCTTPLPSGTTYRAFILVYDGTQWSTINAAGPYAFATMAVDTPAAPTVATAADSANARNTLTLQDLQNVLSTEDATLDTTVGTWVSFLNCAVARSTAQAANGVASLSMTSVAAGRMDAATAVAPSYFTVTPGAVMSALASFRAAVTARTCVVYVYWFKSNLAASTTVFTQAGTGSDTTAGFTQVGGQVTVPADALYARVIVSVQNPAAASEVHYVDKIALTPGTTAVWTRGGLTSLARFEVQRSLDGGGTWAAVKRLYVVGSGVSDLSALDYSDVLQSLTAYDYEVPRGSTATYRVRVNALAGGATITSDWSATSAVVSVGSGWWLKSLTDPTLNVKMNINAEVWTVKSTERQGVFRALGRAGAIVMSDAIGGDDGTLNLAFLDQASYDAFETLRARKESLLLQSPYGANDYIRLGADRVANLPLGYGVSKRSVSVPFVEVDAA